MVKEGFKQTEIGMIPNEWEVVSIGDSYKFKNGLNKEKEYFGYGLPIVNYMDVYKNTFLEPGKIKGKVFLSNNELRAFNVDNGDILFTRTSETHEEIGLTAVVTVKLKNTVFSGFLLRARPYNKMFNTEFCRFCFDNKIVRTQIVSNASYTTRALTNGRVLSGVKIPLPPLPEQKAIAEALSDTDAWIESLEQLIAKKRLIKQGAMQDLLRPKEGWEVKSLFEIAEKKRDLFNDGDWIESEHIIDQGIRLIQTGNVGVGAFLNKHNRKFINEQSFKDLKCKELIVGDILVCRLAEPAGRVCLFPKTSDEKSITSVDVTILRPDISKYDRRLIMYLLSTDEWFNQVLEKVGGTTHKRISRGNLGTLTIHIPQLLIEQTRIANILSDMDTELERLENQLNKARQIKQGMMQELLTGRIRLIENGN